MTHCEMKDDAFRKLTSLAEYDLLDESLSGMTESEVACEALADILKCGTCHDVAHAIEHFTVYTLGRIESERTNTFRSILQSKHS